MTNLSSAFPGLVPDGASGTGMLLVFLFLCAVALGLLVDSWELLLRLADDVSLIRAELCPSAAAVQVSEIGKPLEPSSPEPPGTSTPLGLTVT